MPRHAIAGDVDTVAQSVPGIVLRVVWNPATSQWLYNGAAINARPGGRTDIHLDFLGGADSNRPAWAQASDTHWVTVTP